MKKSILRTLACCAVLGVAALAGVQAQTTSAAGSLPDFTGIVQKNASAVVHVEAKYDGSHHSPQMGPQGQMPSGQGQLSDRQQEILRHFFGMPMMPSPEQQKHISLGSGFIISSDGYVLTNNHVVADADSVTVRLQDRRTLTAKVVGTDSKYDIALLKIDDGNDLPAVTIGNSRSLKAGQWVLAIGSPFGFDYTVTQGIVSAVGRNLGARDQPYTSFIQTDVPINVGNSGGPLFNMQGQVVGINSQILSSTGNYAGISFSIPIDVAMNAVQQLKSKGFVTRGQLGVEVQPVTDDLVKAYHLESGSGAAVVAVNRGSSADKAGLQAGDIILGYNGQHVDQASDLPPMVGLTKPGTKVPVQILRNDKKMTVDVVVGTAPRDEDGVDNVRGGSSSKALGGSSALGLKVKSMDDATRKQLGLKSGEGVVIGSITGEVAAQAGLKAGDVILIVNQQKIGSVADFQNATKNVKAGSTVLLLVRRGDQGGGFIALTVPDNK